MVRASCKLGDTADALGVNGGILADASSQGSAGSLGNARPAPDSRARKRIVALSVPIEADRSATDQGLLPCSLFRRAFCAGAAEHVQNRASDLLVGQISEAAACRHAAVPANRRLGH